MSAHEAMNKAQFFHGTAADLAPGETIDPNGGYTYFTNSHYEANRYARSRALNNKRMGSGGPPAQVYPVEPTGDYGDDPRATNAFRSLAPLRVTGKPVAAPDTEGMRKMATSYRAPAPKHGKLYVGKDANFEQDNVWKDDRDDDDDRR